MPTPQHYLMIILSVWDLVEHPHSDYTFLYNVVLII